MINIEYSKSVRIKNKEIALLNDYINIDIYGDLDYCNLLSQIYSDSLNDFYWAIRIRSFEDELAELEDMFSNYDTELKKYSKRQLVTKTFSELIIRNINREIFALLSDVLDRITGDVNILLFLNNYEKTSGYIDTLVFKDDESVITDLEKLSVCPVMIFTCNESSEILLKNKYFNIIQNSIHKYLESQFVK